MSLTNTLSSASSRGIQVSQKLNGRQAKPLNLLSSFQFQWAVGAFASAALSTLLWLQWPISLAIATIVVTRLLTARRHPGAWPTWLRLLCTLIAVGLVISTYGSIFGRAPGGALLLIMMAMKCTESATRRDARLLVTVSFFVIIASFLMEQNILAMLTSAFATVICFGALEVLVRPNVSGTHSPFKRIATGNILGLLSLAIPITVALWLLFPRLSTPMWGTADSGQNRSGLSDEVKPNSFADLLLDDSPLMRIRFADRRPRPSELYFRGYVLWEVAADGTWKASRGFGEQYADQPKPQADDLRYEVILEATDQRMLYVADAGVEVNQSEVVFSNERRFLRSVPVHDVLRYSAISRLSNRAPERLDVGPKSWIQRFATELPAEINPRTRAYAALLRNKHQGDRLAMAREVLALFRNGPYRYTLSPDEALGINTTDQFLFVTQNGYCQHYASAFAWILRAADVPTRVVVGYTGGKYFGTDGNDPYLLVTQAQAHAWNEVLVGEEWIRFDPTAEIPIERIDPDALAAFSDSDQGLWQNLLEVREQVANWWAQTVLNFNADRQRNILKPFGVENADWPKLAIALVIAISASTLLWLCWNLYHNRRKRGHPIDEAFQSVLIAADKAGLKRELTESALSLAKRAHATQLPWARAFAELCERYTQLCYQQSIEQQGPTQVSAFKQQADLVRKLIKPGFSISRRDDRAY